MRKLGLSRRACYSRQEDTVGLARGMLLLVNLRRRLMLSLRWECEMRVGGWKEARKCVRR